MGSSARNTLDRNTAVVVGLVVLLIFTTRGVAHLDIASLRQDPCDRVGGFALLTILLAGIIVLVRGLRQDRDGGGDRTSPLWVLQSQSHHRSPCCLSEWPADYNPTRAHILSCCARHGCGVTSNSFSAARTRARVKPRFTGKVHFPEAGAHGDSQW